MRTFTWLGLAVFFFISACTKIESTNIGSGLIPPIDGVNTLDTSFEVDSKNFFDPNAEAEKVYKSDDQVIGVINNDPLFGKTTATAYFELKPTFYKYYFPSESADEIHADSAVLILSYKGLYGDSMIPQKWEVRELSELIRPDTTFTVGNFFTANNLLNNPVNLDITKFNDSVYNNYEAASNQIRIKLSSEFANRLINQYDSTGAYKTDSIFKTDYFKGFAVSPGSAGNALIRINLLDTNTKLALYYDYKNPAGRDTSLVSYFRFSSGSSTTVSASANYIKRDYASSKLLETIAMAKPVDSLLYIQTSPGTFATIKIPGLSSFPNCIIHRAELLMYQVPDDATLNQLLTPPQLLFLSIYDSTLKVKRNIPNDFIFSTAAGTTVISSTSSNLSTFGGYILQRSVPGYENINNYTFDLSRYVQGIVTRKDSSYTLRLSAPANDSLLYTPPYPANTTSATYYNVPSTSNITAFGRVCLGGRLSRSNALRMRLHIVYSKI